MKTGECYYSERMNSYSRIMLRLLSEKRGHSVSCLIETSAKLLAEEFQQDKKGQILMLALTESMECKEPKEKLSHIDIETLQASDALLLALARQQHGNIDFGADNEPRLKGLIQYQRFANLRQQVFFSETVSLINRAGIIPLAAHDSAMKYYRPDSLRCFDALELIALSQDDYSLIRSELSKAEFFIDEKTNYFEACPDDSGNGMKLIVLNADSLRKDIPELLPQTIAERGGIRELNHAQCYIPSPEDMVLLTANRIWEKLKNSNHFPGVAFDIMDLCYLIRAHGVSQDVISKRIHSSDIHISEYFFTAKFVNGIIDGLLPFAQPSEAEFEPVIENFVRAERRRIDFLYNRRNLRHVIGRTVKDINIKINEHFNQ